MSIVALEPARIYSPHLADSTLAQDFKMAMSVVPSPEDVRGIAQLMSQPMPQPELPHADR